MGDDHTGIDYQRILQSGGIFPLTLYNFSDGLYVLGAFNKYEPVLGCRITAINDVPIAEATAMLSSLLAKTNDALIKHRIPNMLPSIAHMEDDPDSLIPDITVETTFDDFAAGKDPMLDE